MCKAQTVLFCTAQWYCSCFVTGRKPGSNQCRFHGLFSHACAWVQALHLLYSVHHQAASACCCEHDSLQPIRAYWSPGFARCLVVSMYATVNCLLACTLLQIATVQTWVQSDTDAMQSATMLHLTCCCRSGYWVSIQIMSLRRYKRPSAGPNTLTPTRL